MRLARRWVRQGHREPLKQLVDRAIAVLVSDPDEQRLLRIRAANRFLAVSRPHPTNGSPYYGYALARFEEEPRYETPEEALTRTVEWVYDCLQTHERNCKCGGWREPGYVPGPLPDIGPDVDDEAGVLTKYPAA